jgi:RNA polymerase sigma-70 factor (ECF subfamily)
VIRTQLGDREAADELLRRIAPRLSAYLRSVLGSREDANDLLQDVLLIIYRKVRWLKDPAYLSAWAYRIAGREAVRFLQRRKGARHVQLTEEEWSAVRSRQTSAPADQRVLEEQVARSLEALPPAGRAVLCLHYLEGLSIEEAAQHLGIATGTAKSRLSFGLRKLRERLGLARSPGGITK